MTRLKYFLLGSLVAISAGAYALPPVLAGIPYSSCAAISNVALSTTSETVFASNGDRTEFCVSNRDSSIEIYLALHATATSADVRIGPGQTLCHFESGGRLYTGVVDALAASGTPAISGYSCSK